MKQSLKYAAVAAAMLAAQSASATTVSITYDGAAAGFRSGTIDEIDIALAGGRSNVVAGGFNMVDSTPGGLGSFLAFCLDLGAYLSASGPEEYILTDTPFQNGSEPILAAGQARISAIFDANFGDEVTSTADHSAAFQFALWEAVYDDDMDISTGTFQASSSDRVETLAMAYLDAAQNYTGPRMYELGFLESTAPQRRQNIVTASLAPVPLPAAGLLLLGALGGLMGTRRLKKAA